MKAIAKCVCIQLRGLRVNIIFLSIATGLSLIDFIEHVEIFQYELRNRSK